MITITKEQDIKYNTKETTDIDKLSDALRNRHFDVVAELNTFYGDTAGYRKEHYDEMMQFPGKGIYGGKGYPGPMGLLEEEACFKATRL